MSGPLEAVRVLECGCGDRPRHCDPHCEACRIHGMNRVHPRHGYNTGATPPQIRYGRRITR